MPRQRNVQKPKRARIGAPFLSRTCLWQTHPSASDGWSRSSDCCQRRRAGGAHRWMCNASAVPKRRWAWPCDQLRRLTPLFGKQQVLVGADRWSGTPDMLRACRASGSSVLIRLKSHRTRYRKPARRSPPGRPPHDGPLVHETRPETRCDPSASWEATDEEGRTTWVNRCDDIPVQQDRDLILSVRRVERHAARRAILA
jgi:hypothetical protein